MGKIRYIGKKKKDGEKTGKKAGKGRKRREMAGKGGKGQDIVRCGKRVLLDIRSILTF